MFLRIYRPEDKRQLQQLFFDTVHTINARDYTPEQLAALAPTEPDRLHWSRLDDQFCFVVECQKMPVGFVSLWPEGILDFLYVHPHFQGKGIATALCKQVERLARKHNFSTIQTVTGITARSFFERKGFILLAETCQMLRGVEFRHYKMEKLLQPQSTALHLGQVQKQAG